jgi:hypothetical protein
MKKLLSLIVLLGFSLSQSLFADLPAIEEANLPPIVITKIKTGDSANLTYGLAQAEKWAKFVFPASTGKCQGLDAYTMTGGFFQVEGVYRNEGYIEVRPSFPEPAYAVYGVTKGNNRYVIVFLRSGVTPNKLQSVVRCRLQ